jgi:hypothetical protein
MKLLTGLLCTMTIVGAEKRAEHSILSMYGDRAFRPDSGTLCIVTDQVDTLVFSDHVDTDCLEDIEAFELCSFLPEQNCWVISKTCYEWAIMLLVEGSDGSKSHAVSDPEPSPDGTRLLCTFEDILAEFYCNSIQVWRVDRDGLVIEFQDLDVPWGPVHAGWAGDSLIVFEKLTYDWHLDEYTTRPGSLELSEDGTWTSDDEADW